MYLFRYFLSLMRTPIAFVAKYGCHKQTMNISGGEIYSGTELTS